MLDIHFIRENAELVKEGARKKNVDVDIDRLLVIDDERKQLMQQLEDRRAEQNRASRAVIHLQGEEKEKLLESMRHLKSGMAQVQQKFDELHLEWTKLILSIPNIPSPDTPEGKDEAENVVVREVGDKPAFSFTAKPHWELGVGRGLLNTEKAGEVSGARFSYLMGDLVLLQFALVDTSYRRTILF